MQNNIEAGHDDLRHRIRLVLRMNTQTQSNRLKSMQIVSQHRDTHNCDLEVILGRTQMTGWCQTSRPERQPVASSQWVGEKAEESTT